MIKFFRQMRQRLLLEGKTGNYLKYAFGEIILVVIGILIALQINNWNEQRKINILEVEVLKEIASDLQDDLISLENDVALNNRGLKSAFIIREVLGSHQKYHDSIANHFGNLDFNPTYTLKTSGYDNLKNLGFQIIASDSLRKSITDLYATEYSFLKEREELSEQRTYDYFSPLYLAYFSRLKSIDGVRGRKSFYIPKDFEALKYDPAFNALLDYIILVKNDNLFSINLTLKKLKQTQALINNYLNTIASI